MEYRGYGVFHGSVPTISKLMMIRCGRYHAAHFVFYVPFKALAHYGCEGNRAPVI